MDFVKHGNSANANKLGLSVESYCEVAFSYSRPITERLSLGGRIKGLTGMMNMGMNFDKFEIAKGSNKWIADVKGRF